MQQNIYKGVITAMITPLKNNKIDFDALELLISRQIDAQIDGIVIAGSTGEGTCLSVDEFDNLLLETSNILSGKIPIIAGVSTASTADALQRVKIAQKHNINGLMLTVPYYIKPSENGIIEHFKILHDNSDLPIMIYNHPGRTGTDLNDNVIMRLAQIDRIVALKDASCNIHRPVDLSRSAQLKDDFNFLTGNDDEILAYIASGGSGVVSVLSNIIPRTLKGLWQYINAGQTKEAIKLYQNILDISEKIFSVSNPIGVKCAYVHLGHCQNELRMPLLPASDDISDNIRSTIRLVNELETGFKQK